MRRPAAGPDRRHAPALALALFGVLVGAAADEFTAPEAVAILGYSGDAMEAHLSCDGQLLFFNDTNEPGFDTDLHYAERIDDLTFDYRGRLAGANSTALDAVPSLDCSDEFFFVSTRTYGQTLSTLYRATYAAGALSNVTLIAGLSKLLPGWANFDAEITRDGGELYFVDGRFDGGSLPAEADLAIARRTAGGFERHPDSTSLLAAVHSAGLEYAPATTDDGLELYFTRVEADGPHLFRAVRPTRDAPFGPPAKLAAATGLVEAPALSPDALALYYHRAEAGVFSLWRVTRAARHAVFGDGFESGDEGSWSSASAVAAARAGSR